MMRSAALVLLIATALPGAAHAFSDYEVFALPVLEGGGGGRYFTGSSADGYTCGVCHLGGRQPNVELRGLPEREFVPGAVYDVEIIWQAFAVPHALNLEFVTPSGEAAGTIVLPDPNSLEPADRCDAVHENAVATQLIPESAPRQVLWVDDCGAQRVRFRYVAPNVPQLMFAASLVRTAAPDDGCSVGRSSRRRPVASWLAAGLAALLWRRRRRVR
jgi:MYXO-CTERM domain-containing protein